MAVDLNASTSNVFTHTLNPSHDSDLNWRIDNALTFADDVLTSPLPLSHDCKTKINTIVKLKVDDGGRFTDVSVGFQRTDKQRCSVRLNYDVSLVNCHGDVYLHKKSHIQCDRRMYHFYVMSIKFTKGDVIGDPVPDGLDGSILEDLTKRGLVTFDEGQQFLYLLPNDVLFVKGVLTVFGCCIKTRNDPRVESTPLIKLDSSESQVALRRDFRNALDQNVFADVKLNVNGHIYLVHKFVLAARSPMLRRVLEEADLKTLEVDEASKEADPEVMKVEEEEQLDHELSIDEHKNDQEVLEDEEDEPGTSKDDQVDNTQGQEDEEDDPGTSKDDQVDNTQEQEDEMSTDEETDEPKTENCIKKLRDVPVFQMTNIENSVFEEVLDFMYTGVVEAVENWETVINVYQAANQLQIWSLRSECGRKILNDITADQACDILTLADQHGDEYLKDGVMNFITKNFEEIKDTEEWEVFIDSNTHLAAQVLKQYSSCKRRK